jgi:hypothetical protein
MALGDKQIGEVPVSYLKRVESQMISPVGGIKIGNDGLPIIPGSKNNIQKTKIIQEIKPK